MFRKFVVVGSVIVLSLCTSACAFGGPGKAADLLNPFAEGGDGPELGERNANAILDEGGGGKQSEKARQALEVMGSYRRAQAPQPYVPVMGNSEVRRMWVPDHLNQYGDLVPAHYYFLRVKDGDFAVQDSFEMFRQLENAPGPRNGRGASSGGSGAAPFIYKSSGR